MNAFKEQDKMKTEQILAKVYKNPQMATHTPINF